VHVSGHPRVEELKDMIGWVRPQILLPAHGEPLHMAEHAALGRRLGVGKVVLCRDGELIKLAPGGLARSTRYPPDGCTRTVRCWSGRTNERSPTAAGSGFAGVVSIALALSDRGELIGDPQVTLTGIPEVRRARAQDRGRRL
jgi:ribonuclease J